MRRWLFVFVGSVVGVALLAYVIGSFLPRDHVAAMTIELGASPGSVWALVSDFERTPRWRSDVTAVRLTPQPDGRIRFTESSAQGDIPFEVVSQEPPHRQVVRIVDDDQPFGGTWTWQIEVVLPDRVGTARTRVTITEAGFVKNPIFRTVGLIFFSPTDTIEAYLRALATALGESAEPRKLD